MRNKTLAFLPLALLVGLACAEPDDEEEGGTTDSGAATSDGGGADGGGSDGGGADGGGSDGGGEPVDCLTLSDEDCRGAEHCQIQSGYPLVRQEDGYCFDDSEPEVELGCSNRDCQAAPSVVTSTSAPEDCQWYVPGYCVPAGHMHCDSVNPSYVDRCR